MNNTKIISILVLLIIFQHTYGQLHITNPSKEIPKYQQLYGDGYKDSVFSFVGNIHQYKMYQKELLEFKLKIKEIVILGKDEIKHNSPEILLPVGLEKLELSSLSFFNKINFQSVKNTLKEIKIEEVNVKTIPRDTIRLDFSMLDSLENLTIYYYCFLDCYGCFNHLSKSADDNVNTECQYVKINFPPNVRVLNVNIPYEYIITLPKSIEKLYLFKDNKYPASILTLPNLWYISFYGNLYYPLPKEIINIPTIKHINFSSRFFTKNDVETLAQIPKIDTLSIHCPIPENIYLLKNVSVILFEEYNVPEQLQKMLPNAIIYYKRNDNNQYIRYEEKW